MLKTSAASMSPLINIGSWRFGAMLVSLTFCMSTPFLCANTVSRRVVGAEAGVVGARHHAGHRRAGALALVDDDVEALGFEVAFVTRDEEGGIAALRLPSERELDGGLLGACRCGEQQAEGERRDQSFEHRCSPAGLNCLTFEIGSRLSRITLESDRSCG